MECPFCKQNKVSRHLRWCKSNNTSLSDIDLRKLYLEHNFPNICTYENLVLNYITNQMSLSKIYELYKIDYNSIKFLLNLYKIPIRNISESNTTEVKNKREKTCLKKYGSKNVLSKDTSIYKKRNATIKNKYGVDNIFQVQDIINRIRDDTYYLKKYDMTLNELRRKNALNYYNSLSEEDKLKWHEKMGKSFSTKIKKRNKDGILTSKIEKKVIEALIELDVDIETQKVITDNKKVYFYDVYLKPFNLIIEINGDYWHANPMKFKETEYIRKILVKDIWKGDKEKAQVSIKHGYNIIHIWESEIVKLKKDELKTYLISKIEVYK